MPFPSSVELEPFLSDASNPENFAELFRLAYTELRRMAGYYFRNEREYHTLQPTALVGEVYIRLFEKGPESYDNAAHFFGYASSVMRHVLVDYARKRNAQIRGGGWERVPLDQVGGGDCLITDWVAVDEALTRLAEVNSKAAEVAKLKIFGGLNSDEIAKIKGWAAPTVRKYWCQAKEWLNRDLGSHFNEGD